jgi:formate dehydrogenase maturation protein FdhE
MHSIMSRAGTLIQSSVYNNIGCQFVVCETCLSSVTVFRSVERQRIKNNGNIQVCPICSGANISLISITNDTVIFNSRLIKYDQEKYMLD